MYRKANCRFSRTLFSSSRDFYRSFPKRHRYAKFLHHSLTRFLTQLLTKWPFFSSPSEREQHAPLLPRILELARYRTIAFKFLAISKGLKPPFLHFCPFHHYLTPRHKTTLRTWQNLEPMTCTELTKTDELEIFRTSIKHHTLFSPAKPPKRNFSAAQHWRNLLAGFARFDDLMIADFSEFSRRSPEPKASQS